MKDAILNDASANPQSAIRIPQSESGLVLITVLWVILVLSLVSLSLASAVRVELAFTRQSFDSERAFFMAKGAAEVVYNAYSKQQEIPAGSPIRVENLEYIFPFESGEARVRLESAAGRIDLNAASDALLAAMLDSMGLDQGLRNRLVDSILDWRDADDIPHLNGAEVNDYGGNSSGQISLPRNDKFESVDELLLVKNMTPEIFYGGLAPGTDGQYRRVPALRDLVTVQSARDKVNPNEASPDVLTALPSITAELAQSIVTTRGQKRFANEADFVARVPGMGGLEALQYMDFEERALPSALVSTATIASSGVSRTVRLLFTEQRKVQFISVNPLIFRLVQDRKLDRWRFD